MRRVLSQTSAVPHGLSSSTFGMSIQGLATIRAYKFESMFRSTFLMRNDLNGAWWYTKYALNRWLGARLEIVNSVFLAAVIALTIASKDKVCSAYLASHSYHSRFLNQHVQETQGGAIGADQRYHLLCCICLYSGNPIVP